MGSLTDAWENVVLDAVFGGSFSPPATLYVGLLTTGPADAGTGGVEVTGGSYARVAVTNDLTHWPAASAGQKSNGVDITWPTATASWGTVVSFGVWTALTSGTMICYGDLGTAATINSGVTAKIPIGDLVLTCD